jgi:hypothetical protein
MSGFRAQTWLFASIVLICFARPAAAFGAGNIASISKVEGQNCKQNDIVFQHQLCIWLQVLSSHLLTILQGVMETLKIPC